jgi:hypothetical protein
MIQKIYLFCGGIVLVLAFLLPNGPTFAKDSENSAGAIFAVR